MQTGSARSRVAIITESFMPLRMTPLEIMYDGFERSVGLSFRFDHGSGRKGGSSRKSEGSFPAHSVRPSFTFVLAAKLPKRSSATSQRQNVL
jgi:hypothetical protein